MMEHTPIRIQVADLGTQKRYYLVNNIGVIVGKVTWKKEADSIVTACNNHEKMVELLKVFTSSGYICDDCEVRINTDACSNCNHGIAIKLLSSIESGTPLSAPICSYPPTITYECSGVEVENPKYKYWMEGYNAR